MWVGMAEVSHQQDVIARIQPKQAADIAAIAARVSNDGEPGKAAYCNFHATRDPPSNLAVAALGQRDSAPTGKELAATRQETYCTVEKTTPGLSHEPLDRSRFQLLEKAPAWGHCWGHKF